MIERARSEQGMTVVEVIVAAVIVVLGALAIFSLVAAGARNTYRAEGSQVVSDRLQQEMEAIKRLRYDQVAWSQRGQFLTNPQRR